MFSRSPKVLACCPRYNNGEYPHNYYMMDLIHVSTKQQELFLILLLHCRFSTRHHK